MVNKYQDKYLFDFVQKIQKFKMKELWNNDLDNIWDSIFNRK